MSIPATPTVLCILDGWGHNPSPEHNAIHQAHTPNWDDLLTRFPHGLIHASEGEVGLPCGQMGNSEVGHMNIGAGRVVMQELPRIDAAIEDGSLSRNPALIRYIDALKQSGGTCHVMGLVSDGGVHAHEQHIAALASYVADAGVPVAIHAFLDGRDTPPRSATTYLAELEAALEQAPLARIATLCGRYFAMDRDTRWERVSQAYHLLVDATGTAAPDAQSAIAHAYKQAGQSDEFVTPYVIGDYTGMRDGDGLLMANFRADRAREILQALLLPSFDGFARNRLPHFAATLGMVEYSEQLAAYMPALFPPQTLANGLGEIISHAGLRQFRVAETEKYAHVTFFLNGGREAPFAGEERVLIPSPNVATYDLKPEMSAYEVTDALVAAIESGDYALLIVNYANTDMVGHTGNLNAAKQAVEAVDRCMGRVRDAVLNMGGRMMITADHGNAERMHDEDSGQAHTAHTLNLVPAVLVSPALDGQATRPVHDGRLADIAPTLLYWMGITPPAEMTGTSLLAIHD